MSAVARARRVARNSYIQAKWQTEQDAHNTINGHTSNHDKRNVHPNRCLCTRHAHGSRVTRRRRVRGASRAHGLAIRSATRKRPDWDLGWEWSSRLHHQTRSLEPMSTASFLLLQPCSRPGTTSFNRVEADAICSVQSSVCYLSWEP